MPPLKDLLRSGAGGGRHWFLWFTAEQPTTFETFVCDRILEIQKLSSFEEWFHVAGKSNTADVATRDVSAGSLISSSEWLNLGCRSQGKTVR